MAGARLPSWRAAELIAAEGIAGRPPDANVGDRVLLAWMRLMRPQRSCGRSSEDGPTPRDDEVRSPARSGVDLADSTRTAALGHAADETAGPFGAAQRAAVRADPRSNDPFALDARLRAAVIVIRRADSRVGELLRRFVDLRGHRFFGFTSTETYVRDRLGISARKAWALVKIDRQSARAPEYAAAYERGALSWIRALILLPVVDRRNAAAWVARADTVTVRRLADEVTWALDRREVLDPDLPLDPPPSDAVLEPLGAPRDPAASHQDRGGVGGRRPEPTARGGLQIGATRAHADPALRLRPAWTRNVTAAAASEVCDAEIGFTGPASVVALFRDAIDAHRAPGTPLWAALERLLSHVVRDWEAEPGHPDPVFARDSWRCAVPACSSRRELHDHHIVWRSHGGDDELENRLAVCMAHHLRGIHRFVIRVTGTAPSNVRWQLGLRDGAPPLMRFIGDRYDGQSP